MYVGNWEKKIVLLRLIFSGLVFEGDFDVRVVCFVSYKNIGDLETEDFVEVDLFKIVDSCWSFFWGWNARL